MKRLVYAFLILLCWQTSSATKVRLVTIGPGDAFWSAFGHTAIAIDDAVYGFGYFSFDDDIVASFIGNQMQYDLGVSDLNYELRLAQQQNRDFSVVDLQLSTGQIKKISDYLQWHMLPENQSYGYDYFLNNCSTKVRDLLNMALETKSENHPQFFSKKSSHSSYLKQTFPAKHQGLMNFGLALGYGWSAYQLRDSWELLAFPVYFEQNLVESSNPVIQAKQVLFEAKESHHMISFIKTHWLLLSYVALWSLLLIYDRSRVLMSKLWFIWHGLIGAVLLSLWLLTPHEVADWNFNVLLMMPLGLLLPRYGKLLFVILGSWSLWLLIAIYLNAWYLMPLMIPALLSLRVQSGLLSKTRVSRVL